MYARQDLRISTLTEINDMPVYGHTIYEHYLDTFLMCDMDINTYNDQLLCTKQK